MFEAVSASLQREDRVGVETQTGIYQPRTACLAFTVLQLGLAIIVAVQAKDMSLDVVDEGHSQNFGAMEPHGRPRGATSHFENLKAGSSNQADVVLAQSLAEQPIAIETLAGVVGDPSASRRCRTIRWLWDRSRNAAEHPSERACRDRVVRRSSSERPV